nr:MAG TPA: C2H2 type zinc-finger protein [Caudoviricetes sp.]
MKVSGKIERLEENYKCMECSQGIWGKPLRR